MRRPFVSIIVVTYNAECYLTSCIAGLLAQTFQNFELLLVDDGSTDNTGVIGDGYAKQDARVRVFHAQHQGVAHARQVGIEHASGEYTIHIDADDWIGPTMLEEMAHAAEAEEADMLICDYREKRSDGIFYHKQQPSVLTKEAVANDLVEGRLYGALWNKLIKTSVFRDNHIGFRQELNMREDMFFIFDLLPFVGKVAYLPKAYYTYDRTNNSASLTNTYLKEDDNYYNQEIRWHKAALESSLIGVEQKRKLRNSLLNYAYITLEGMIFDRSEWLSMFSHLRNEFSMVKASYKKMLVETALGGHYSIAHAIRRMLVFIKKL